jgi:hypothetical protein
LDIDLNFATSIDSSDMFQVWGIAKSGRDFKPSICNLKNKASRDACFTLLHRIGLWRPCSNAVTGCKQK